MAENPIQGFQTDTGVEQYDYNALANKPTLMTQTEIDAAITTANRYTDEQIAKIDTTPIVQIELDTSLSVQGKAADAKAVGDAISKLSGGNVENGEDGFSPIATVEQTENGAIISITDKNGTTTATITNGKDGTDGTNGTDGKDYILTEADKTEIAEITAELVNVSNFGGNLIYYMNIEVEYPKGDGFYSYKISKQSLSNSGLGIKVNDIIIASNGTLCKVTGVSSTQVDYDPFGTINGNNNASDSVGKVSYDEAQELTEEQKAQARENIDAQPAGDYLIEVPSDYAKTEEIPTDSHINSLIDAKLAQFTNVAEVGA